jgi:hypothetical protein
MTDDMAMTVMIAMNDRRIGRPPCSSVDSAVSDVRRATLMGGEGQVGRNIPGFLLMAHL